LSETTSYDVAIHICPALRKGVSGTVIDVGGGRAWQTSLATSHAM
jgi:hypothetical protein